MKISSTIILKAIAKNGRYHQSVKAMEECGELTQAISKCLTDGENKQNIKHLTEELADNYITMEEVREMYGISFEDIQEIIYQKLERLERNLECCSQNQNMQMITEKQPSRRKNFLSNLWQSLEKAITDFRR
jgi:NTP pyrophosphatase (non-canonical NTP hydrolase)